MFTACYATVGNMGGIIGPQIYGLVGVNVPERDGEPDYRYAYDALRLHHALNFELSHCNCTILCIITAPCCTATQR